MKLRSAQPAVDISKAATPFSTEIQSAWARFGLAQCKPAMIMILVGHGLLGPETGRFQKNDKNHAELCEIHKYCNIFPHWRDFHFLHLQLQHTSYG
jgi:hypothetical protein